MRAIISLAALALSALTCAAPAAAQSYTVPVDHTGLLRLSADAATVVVGNPAIADVVIHDPRTLFISGHVYGQTNLIVLGADGRLVYASDISVTASGRDHVSVFKNVARHSYVCDPVCHPVGTIGDDGEQFQLIQGQRSAIRSEAQGAAGSGG